MNRWIHPTRTCPKHDNKPLLVTRSGVVFCAEGLDPVTHEPTCIHEVPEVAIPKAVARAMRRLRKRTRRMLRKQQG